MRRLLLALVVSVVATALCPTALPRPAAGAALHEATVRIGTSVRGRPIVAVHRWSDGASRTTLVIGSMHGDERAGMRVVRLLRSASLPGGVDLWLVRTMNPDGTAADRRTNAHGVDLNRNFPRFWRLSGTGTTQWSGPSPASEPETRAMQAFLRRVDPLTTLSFHQPLNGVDSYRAKSMTLVRRLSRELGLPVKWFDCHGGCTGTMTDWANGRLDGRYVTVELGATASDRQVRRVAGGILRVATPS